MISRQAVSTGVSSYRSRTWTSQAGSRGHQQNHRSMMAAGMSTGTADACAATAATHTAADARSAATTHTAAVIAAAVDRNAAIIAAAVIIPAVIVVTVAANGPSEHATHNPGKQPADNRGRKRRPTRTTYMANANLLDLRGRLNQLLSGHAGWTSQGRT